MKFYFMGICGTAMGNVALLLKGMGHEVVGADTHTYPPMSDALVESGIEILSGYDPERLAALNPDQVVIGNAISRGNPEVEWLLESRALAYGSLPALLNEHVLSQRRNLVIAGTHGKTTTTSVAAYLLVKNGFEPGYLIGGIPRDLPGGSSPGHGDGPFVIEGDEYDSAFFDKRSKFVHYAPNVLAINNLEFDHADIFHDLADVRRSFQHAMRLVPRSGCIVYNGDDEILANAVDAPWTHRLRVGEGKSNDLVISNFHEDATGSEFELIWRGQLWGAVRWGLAGFYNARNSAMAALSAGYLVFGEDPTQLDLSCLSDFIGPRRRQECLYMDERLVVIEDFGHHPTALWQTLQSLRKRYPEYRLTACFEPRSNTARTKLFQSEFTAALALADEVLLGAVYRLDTLQAHQPLDTQQMVSELQNRGCAARAFEENDDLLEVLQTIVSRKNCEQRQLICFFSNGAFGGIIRALQTQLDEKHL